MTAATAPLFTAADYDTLAAIVFRPDYPGNATARGVVELPNGDGRPDAEKHYSHVAVKYLRQMEAGLSRTALACDYLLPAWQQSMSVARELNVPEQYLPSFAHGALRVLRYPANTGSALHTDFDLFTLNLYRDVYNYGLGVVPMRIHMGEIGELVGMGNAFPHKVIPVAVPQHSIVYFAMPDHAAVLPDGTTTVGEWLRERMGRSRIAEQAAQAVADGRRIADLERAVSRWTEEASATEDARESFEHAFNAANVRVAELKEQERNAGKLAVMHSEARWSAESKLAAANALIAAIRKEADSVNGKYAHPDLLECAVCIAFDNIRAHLANQPAAPPRTAAPNPTCVACRRGGNGGLFDDGPFMLPHTCRSVSK